MNLDGVRNHPDLNLAKSGFEGFLELSEKCAHLGGILNINHDFDVDVLERFPSV
jgi:hypothetical protein